MWQLGGWLCRDRPSALSGSSCSPEIGGWQQDAPQAGLSLPFFRLQPLSVVLHHTCCPCSPCLCCSKGPALAGSERPMCAGLGCGRECWGSSQPRAVTPERGNPAPVPPRPKGRVTTLSPSRCCGLQGRVGAASCDQGCQARPGTDPAHGAREELFISQPAELSVARLGAAGAGEARQGRQREHCTAGLPGLVAAGRGQHRSRVTAQAPAAGSRGPGACSEGTAAPLPTRLCPHTGSSAPCPTSSPAQGCPCPSVVALSSLLSLHCPRGAPAPSPAGVGQGGTSAPPASSWSASKGPA